MTTPQQPSQPYGYQQQQPTPAQPYSVPSATEIRNKVSSFSNAQIFSISMIVLTLILWGLRTLSWVNAKSTEIDNKGIRLHGNGKFVAYEEKSTVYSFSLKMIASYTAVLLILMLVSAGLAFSKAHLNRALRLGGISIITYFVLSILTYLVSFSIPGAIAKLSDEDPEVVKEQVSFVPGIGLILTWLVLVLIIAAAVYFLNQSKKAAQASAAFTPDGQSWMQQPQQSYPQQPNGNNQGYIPPHSPQA
ncbi:hypothetical protein [Corynebacterium sp. sy039]|uniref:hypothetical protein n=1 Tax=Corynebacterium sp. sy039 TaxID=2599641 RepID=UPI0011B7AF7F|nr:hypothetical protein [Corynebacterium sp. sy039]QDZ42762.1 hypothetical protein FQV43_06025 [Corynebacterium sp. sy039]